MPPKKKEEPVTKPILGRFKSNLKVGVVGLPNVRRLGRSPRFFILFLLLFLLRRLLDLTGTLP